MEKHHRVSQYIRCKYCTYSTFRRSKRGGDNTITLFKHVVDHHEKEFLHAVGWNGTLDSYIDHLFNENEREDDGSRL